MSVSQPYIWGKQKTTQLLKIDFIRFGVVGAVGFLVTAIFLQLFHGVFGLDIFPATLLASEIGLLSNFVFHEKWTYKSANHKDKPLWTKFWQFNMSSWSGVVLITLIESFCVKILHLNYLFSLIIAAAITMFWNFFWTKYFIFRGHTPAILLEPERAVEETLTPKSSKLHK